MPPSDRLTVFHLDDERGFGGGERQLMYAACALRANGHDNIICCRAGTPLEREAQRLGFDILPLPFLFEFDVVSAMRLARATKGRHRPVLHAHTGHTVGIAATSRLFGGPHAIAHRRGAHRLKSGLSRWLKYDCMTRVVAISRAVESLTRRGGLAADRIVVIPDCIPTTPQEWRVAGDAEPRLAPASAAQRMAARHTMAQAFGIDPAHAWVGNLASLVPLKDHATLIAAAEVVVRQHPDTTFVIGGQGPERDRLQADIARRRLTGRVVLLGQYDAATVFAAIDLFVLTSTREGMGSVLLEAASCRVPVIATAVGGIPEIVRDGETGLLVLPGDQAGIARAIAQLLDHPVRARQLASHAHNALPRFGLAETARQLEMVYAIALAARGDAP